MTVGVRRPATAEQIINKRFSWKVRRGLTVVTRVNHCPILSFRARAHRCVSHRHRVSKPWISFQQADANIGGASLFTGASDHAISDNKQELPRIRISGQGDGIQGRPQAIIG